MSSIRRAIVSIMSKTAIGLGALGIQARHQLDA
jgi:hypothetical protein